MTAGDSGVVVISIGICRPQCVVVIGGDSGSGGDSVVTAVLLPRPDAKGVFDGCVVLDYKEIQADSFSDANPDTDFWGMVTDYLDENYKDYYALDVQYTGGLMALPMLGA